MGKIIKYEIVNESSTTALENVINDRIADGWQPLGGVGSTNVQFEVRWFQAVVEYQQIELPKAPTQFKTEPISI